MSPECVPHCHDPKVQGKPRKSTLISLIVSAAATKADVQSHFQYDV